MADMHPHWQLQDETPIPVRIAGAGNAEPVRTRVDAVRVSRIPGAVIGIFLTLAIGLAATRTAPALLEQTQSLLASLTSDPFQASSSSQLSAADSSAVSVAPAASSEGSSIDAPAAANTSSLQSSAPADGALAGIPQNPFTVDTPSPSDATPTSLAKPASQLHEAAAPRPPRQPASGPEIWITLTGALGSMLLVWKRSAGGFSPSA